MEPANFTMYDSVFNSLVKKISQGEFKEGDKLPSVSKLCKMYSTSDATIRKSIFMLKSKGFIISVNRVGYFVAGNKDIAKQIFPFSEKMNIKNSGNRFEILSVSQYENNKDDAIVLPGRTMRIERLYYMDILPVYLKIIHFPFRAKIKKPEGSSWINEIDEVFSSHFMKKKLTFTVSNDELIKNKLYIPVSMQMMEVKKVFYTADEKLAGVEYLYAPASEINLEMSYRIKRINQK